MMQSEDRINIKWWDLVYTTNERIIFHRIELPHGWIVKDIDSNNICFVPKLGKNGW